MKPCDYKDQYSIDKYISGISYNGRSITVRPPNVVLNIDCCKLTIPMHLFKRFAEWYLEDEDEFFDR